MRRVVTMFIIRVKGIGYKVKIKVSGVRCQDSETQKLTPDTFFHFLNFRHHRIQRLIVSGAEPGSFSHADERQVI